MRHPPTNAIPRAYGNAERRHTEASRLAASKDPHAHKDGPYPHKDRPYTYKESLCV